MEKMKTRQEIANLLGISTKTLYRRMKDANLEIPAGLLSVYDQHRILRLFTHGSNFQQKSDSGGQIV